ncbi:MAG: DUF4446 family protein [Candidatus Eremiobacteraeota bacterium]|nr:DUF4446 family protein [Candidatus Eremiobacteraeota bacterium]
MLTVTIYAAAAAFVGALLALLIYHLTVVRPTLAWIAHLLGMHDGLIAGGTGGAADRFKAVEEAHASTRDALQSAVGRIDALEASALTDVSRVGFVRYDAFNDAESGLSYALALLNRQGDGVVITSIYSRADTRTFGKPVSAFKPTVHASAEELEAIEKARAQT